MRTIYGVKTLTEEDVLNQCGKSKNISEFCLKEEQMIMKELKNVVMNIHKSQRYGCSEINISFVPITLVEELILSQSVVSSAQMAINFMATDNKIILAKEIINEAKSNISNAIDTYQDSLDNGLDPEDILSVIFIHSGGNTEIRIAVPRKILAMINSEHEYTCEHCNKIYSFNMDVLPELMYRVDGEGNVKYLCGDCKDSMNCTNYSHVGDSYQQN